MSMLKMIKYLKICGKGGIIKMNKKQYNNVIENTLKHEKTDDSLSTARAIFNNMGVALPQGDIKIVYETIKTNNYMGWKSCTMQEAQAAANNGTAAIGISQDKIVVLSANDEEQPVTQTALVMTLDENTSAFAVDGLEYYSYSYGGTECSSGCQPQNVEDSDAIYVSTYDESGLWYVGHSYLFLKVSYNNWIKTEFNTPDGTKENARIYVDRNLSSQAVRNVLAQGIRDFRTTSGGMCVDGSEFFPMKGYFQNSISMAEQYEGTNYGEYNLITNNCLTYVRDILKEGYASDSRIRNVINNSSALAPRAFLQDLLSAVN